MPEPTPNNPNPQLIIEYDPQRNGIVYSTNISGCTPLLLGMVEWMRGELREQLNETRQSVKVPAGVQG